jgi:hypothetical protein
MQSITLCETDANQVRPTLTLSPLTLIAGFRAPCQYSGDVPFAETLRRYSTTRSEGAESPCAWIARQGRSHIFVQLRDRRLKALHQDSADLGRRQLPFRSRNNSCSDWRARSELAPHLFGTGFCCSGILIFREKNCPRARSRVRRIWRQLSTAASRGCPPNWLNEY